MRHWKHTFALVLALILLAGCATKRRRDETSKLGKVYHDITSKYNRNFNANVLIDETMFGLMSSYQENYAELLPIYPLADKENPTAVAEAMDQAIEKASVAIAIHRPSHWTDDNYLIIARSQFIKEDFESAEATLRYLIKHYDPENILNASAQKSRNVNRKQTAKERAQEQKANERERMFKIKERQKEIRERKKERKKENKARKNRIRQRKAEIKERERLAKQRSKAREQAEEAEKEALARQSKQKEEQRKKDLFEEDPELPKVKGNPDNYFLKHKPAFQDAKLLLAKTLIERDRFGEAENLLRELEQSPTTFDEIKREIYPAQAHSSISRGQMAAAVAPLQKAVEVERDRQKRARYAFILAQVLERLNQYADAAQAYDEVVNLKPAYEMNFNAALSKLEMQWHTSTLGDDDFDKTIRRLIRDTKNEEYQDKLYYALALKDLKRGDRKEAIANLSESVRASAGNQVQKAESYYTIASLYFDDEDFVKAKYYYDSTLTVMTQQDVRYDEVQSRAKNLSQIAAHLETIQLTDSLLAIGRMSEDEKRALATQIRKERAEKAEAEERAAQQASRAPTASLNAVNQVAGIGATASNFFAYNEKDLKKGLRDFQRTWGDITLQDNWRRSSTLSFGGTEEGEVASRQNTRAPISETEMDEIFKDVPQSQAQVASANRKIEEALFQVGRLFRSELENEEQAIEHLEKLLSRFPETEHALDAYYILYVSYQERSNQAKADHYANLILTQHEDSEFAKYIQNPDYLANALTDDEKVEQYYQNAHQLYDSGDYQEAFRRLRDANDQLGINHPLMSKISLLSAMCVGRLRGREPYINALKELIARYPDTEEEQRAKEIIRLLGIRFTETGDGIEEINPDAYFSLDPNDKLHLILVALKTGGDGKAQNEARIAISDYNKKYHRLDQLNVATIVLDDGNGEPVPLFVVRRFDTREKAISYYDGVQKNLKDFIPDPNSYELFAASQRNYRKIVQLKSIDLYRTYFVKEYLSK